MRTLRTRAYYKIQSLQFATTMYWGRNEKIGIIGGKTRKREMIDIAAREKR